MADAIPDVFYGVCVDGPSETGFFYTTCAGVRSLDRVPDGLAGFTVPAGTCAVFTHRGSIKAFPAMVQRIWKE